MKKCMPIIGKPDERCSTEYDDSFDFVYCPYCGSRIIQSLPWKEFFEKEGAEFAVNAFDSNEGILNFIKILEDNHFVNIMVSGIYRANYAATLTFQITKESDTNQMEKDIRTIDPDEFSIININDQVLATYRVWWD